MGSKTKKTLIGLSVLVGLGLIGMFARSQEEPLPEVKTPVVVQKETPKETKPEYVNGYKVGTIISGISPIEISKKYYEKKKLSDVKADLYAKSLVGQRVVWVGIVDDIKLVPVGDGYVIHMRMEAQKVKDMNVITIWDDEKKFAFLNKEDRIKVSARIEYVDEFLGVNIALNKAQIEVVK
jgi:hypothetical protein